MSKNPVVHFEMPYEDAGRVSKFYANAFGWNMVNISEKMGDYITAATADTDENQMVKTPGTINGGFYPLKASPESKEPSVVISVSDIKAAIKEVEKAGGKILGVFTPKGERTMEPQMIPGIGLWMVFKDTEGNRVSLLQATTR